MPIRNKGSLILALAVVSAASACSDRPQEGPGAQSGEEAMSVEASPGLPEGSQAISFLGDTLFPPELPPEVQARREEQLAEALQALEADPEGVEAFIWAGRRQAYLGDYRGAIETFTRALSLHPEDARLYRHRGHRYISVRELHKALEDFSVAAGLIQGTEDEIEPDGQPNAAGIPTSTLHFNIYYHYGLAHFVAGDFEEAEPIYRTCMDASIHPDSKVATAHWLYMTLRRLGEDEEARDFILNLDLDTWALEVIESGAYLDLLRLYQDGEKNPGSPMPEMDPSSMDGAAFSYGVGNFLLYNGLEDEARAVFERIVDARGQWASFGYIAAEADLARLRAP